MRRSDPKTPVEPPPKGKPGRPASILPTFDSMAACEGATGIPKAVQQQAKRDGCDSFDSHGRVNLEKLLRWLFARDQGANWADRLKRAQALKAETELAVLQGGVVEIEKVHESVDRCCAKAAAVLTQKFETEMPPKQDGLPAEKIAAMNRDALDEVRGILGKPEAYAAGA